MLSHKWARIRSRWFSPFFFQKYWHILGDNICAAIRVMFDTGKLMLGLNEATICLIPKGDTPETLNQFRPISLCNVLLKLVSKVLANRLKLMMSKLTGRYQSSFLSGRSTTDNIVVAQELIHSLSKKRGRKGSFILKVDLEKVYDRIEWSFLEKVLQVTGFKKELVELMIDCFSSAKLVICWNGELLEAFRPSRGLRQGDPYLFVLCMEVLSQNIQRAMEDKKWSPIRVSKTGPGLSHLFFVDDLLLFGEDSFSQARQMEHILSEFCGFSRQRVSRRKSRV